MKKFFPPDKITCMGAEQIIHRIGLPYQIERNFHMLKDDMIIKAGIVHILDSSLGMPVLSDYEIDMGSELADFLKAHIEKFTESDDVKICRFSEDSPFLEPLKSLTPENFVETSKLLASSLYGIMNANIAIPAADIAVAVASAAGTDYLCLLKLDYKTSYTHVTEALENGNSNAIILQKAILPSQGQKLSEAFALNLATGDLMLTEKKYEVNGEKRLYFSELFLNCRPPLSQKTKLDIVTKAVEQVNRKYYGDEDTARKMEIKSILSQELKENGSLEAETIGEKIFKDSPEMQEELTEKLEKYHMAAETVVPKAPQTIKKFMQQKLTTDTGIEITIPMEEYRNPDRVEFITNPDGTVSVLIKNISKLSSR